MRRPRPDETEIVAVSGVVGNQLTGGEEAYRIEWLTKHYFERVADSADGWDTLYRDPEDGRLWELTYPESQLQGGGSPRLSVVSHQEAIRRYGL